MKFNVKTLKVPVETYNKWKRMADQLTQQTGKRYTMSDVQRMWAKEDRTIIKNKKMDWRLF